MTGAFGRDQSVAFAAGISRRQGAPDGDHVRWGDQGISPAAEAPETSRHLIEQLQAGGTTAGAARGHAGAVEVAGGHHRRQGGEQQGRMTTKTEAHAAQSRLARF